MNFYPYWLEELLDKKEEEDTQELNNMMLLDLLAENHPDYN